jgi:hypothetical protein
VTCSVIAFAIGFALAAVLVVDYVRSGLVLGPADRIPYLGVLGMVLLIGSFLTFGFNLLLHALALRSDALYGDSHR